MKSSLIMSALLLTLLVGGCSTTPAAGPPEPQGAQGAQGDAAPPPTKAPETDQERERDRDRDRERDKDRERHEADARCPAGEHSETEGGTTHCVRDG